MIKTVSDLLLQLAKAEAAKLDASDITHAPTIGAMYEGLTRDLLERSLPEGLGLQVVSGFVIDGHGGQSGQIDGMLVRGEGKPVPYQPGNFQWHVKDVLAVFEVKKSLFGTALGEAYDQVRAVTERYSAWIQKASGSSPFNLKPSFRAYAGVTGHVAPAAPHWKAMPWDQHLILHTIMAEQMAPVRIIFGYGGYTTEIGLRTGFLKHLKANLNAPGFGPPSLPSLIVSGGCSLIKLGGHPYHAPLTSKGRWPILASSHHNPILLILELIWTRLSYDYELAELFGEDLEIEGFAPLLDATPTLIPHQPGSYGWAYHHTKLTKAQLASATLSRPWAPVELDAVQFVIVNRLCRDDVDIDESDFVKFVTEDGRTVDEVVRSLIETRLVGLNGRSLELLTTECACVVLPDGRRIAAENNTGRLQRWLNAYQKARQADESKT